MRNLILFIQRFYVFFLFLFLLISSLAILIGRNYYQGSVFISSANRVSGTAFSIAGEVRGYFLLGSENARLLEENSRLRNIMRSSYYVDTVTAVHINDSIYSQQYAYIGATVINNSLNKKYNYITLNKGSRHGVEKGQGVICEEGIVGVVTGVSDRFCTVMSVLNRKASTSPKIDSSNYFGSLKWDGMNSRYAQLTEINRFAPVATGQKVLTSGYSLHYPENIMIGKIAGIELKEGNNFYDIEVELSTDFASLSSVYIVQHLYKKELEALEEEAGRQDRDE
jgi:rod shape-determining protein MreC